MLSERIRAVRLTTLSTMLAAIFLVSSLISAGRPIAPLSLNSPVQKQPVVVELFTSEGCSDCPPADALLKKLSEAQPFDNIEVIALEEHVDYWDHQGWADPFSSGDFTARQNDYASIMPKSSVYTPQMVVDGRAQFIGSRVNEAREQIEAAAKQRKARLLLSLAPASKPHNYTVDLRLEPDSPVPDASSLDFYLAVTEKGLHSNPNAGENSGAALIHGPVVRQLRKLHSVKLPLTTSASTMISLREDWNVSNLTVVAFLVNPHTHQIQAAGSSPLPK
jgi:hypothetical protein